MHLDSLACTVASRSEAARVLNHLREAGFQSDQISVVFGIGANRSQFSMNCDRPHESANPRREFDFFWSLVYKLGIPVLIPGASNIWAVGRVISVLGKEQYPRSLGGVAGVLVDLGMSELEALEYETTLPQNLLIAVQPHNPTEEATATIIMEKALAIKAVTKVRHFQDVQ